MAKNRALTDVSLAKALAAEALATDASYRDALKTPLAETTDPLYREVIALSNSLPPRQRKVLAAFARQGFIDGVSTVLGALDGTSSIGNRGIASFKLTENGRTTRLNGYLQDHFLEAIERQS